MFRQQFLNQSEEYLNRIMKEELEARKREDAQDIHLEMMRARYTNDQGAEYSESA